MIVADGSPPAQRDQLGACTLDVTTTVEGRSLDRLRLRTRTAGVLILSPDTGTGVVGRAGGRGRARRRQTTRVRMSEGLAYLTQLLRETYDPAHGVL